MLSRAAEPCEIEHQELECEPHHGDGPDEVSEHVWLLSKHTVMDVSSKSSRRVEVHVAYGNGTAMALSMAQMTKTW